MAEIDVFVWHDNDGNITAVGVPHPDVVGRVQSIAPAGHGALHLRVPEGHLERLHETHQIDVAKRVVVPRHRAASA
jgi:hypothetical protein